MCGASKQPIAVVTLEAQLRVVDEVRAVYRSMGIPTECELRKILLHSLIATQNAIERDKFAVVLKLVEEGRLTVPVIAEEHFVDDRYRRYLIDGHCRVRAGIELGQRYGGAYVLWSPAGDFRSNLVDVARKYGDVRVRDLEMI